VPAISWQRSADGLTKLTANFATTSSGRVRDSGSEIRTCAATQDLTVYSALCDAAGVKEDSRGWSVEDVVPIHCFLFGLQTFLRLSCQLDGVQFRWYSRYPPPTCSTAAPCALADGRNADDVRAEIRECTGASTSTSSSSTRSCGLPVRVPTHPCTHQSVVLIV
jgi:hypothetical protein